MNGYVFSSGNYIDDLSSIKFYIFNRQDLR